jgi:hypothetical protein
MAFTLTIGGQAYFWKPGTLSITETLGGRSTCEFTIDDADGTLAAPIVGQAVLLLDGAYRIFGGSVESLEIVRYPGVDARVFRVSCVDYHRTLDRRLAGKYSWQQQTAGSIVAEICSNSLQGEAINLDFVQAGPVIERFEIDYPTVAEAIQQVAQLAKMFWTVDYDRQLRFFAADSYAAPFELTPTSTNFTGLTLRSTREQYANRVISRIGQYLRDEQTARFDTNGRTGTGEDPITWMKPDGTRKRWAVTYPIHAKPTVTVNGVEKTVGVQGTDVADWLWNTGSSEVQQDPAAAALTSGAVLEIAYVGLSSEVIALQNTAEVDLRASIEGNSGYYEVLKDGSTEMTRQDANQFAAAILDSLDELSGVATIQTTGLIEALASTARVGQRIHVDVGGYRAGGRAITAVAYGSPCVVTAPGHGRRNGEKVHLTGVQNLSGTWAVNSVTADTFALVGANASGSYAGGGWVYPLTFLVRQIRVADIPGFTELAYSIECVLGPITADAVSFFRDLAVAQGIPPAAPAPVDTIELVAPAAPTGVTLTATSSGDRFGLKTTWAAPSPAGGTTAYQIQARYFTDAGCTTPESDWIDLGTEYGVATLQNVSGYWPRPAATRYCKTQVRGLNSANEYTAWVECAAAVTITATTNTDPIPDAVPADPTSVTTTVTDKEGNYGLTTQWTAPTVMTAVAGFEVQARFYTDSGGSSPDGEWIALGGVDDATVRLDSGFWPRPTDAVRYVRTRVRSLNVYGTPGTWVQAASLATVSVLAAPPAPTVGGSTAVGSATRGGVASFNFTVIVTPNGSPGTTEGYEVQVRYYTDSGATTPESNWIPLGWVDAATLTLSTDYWPRPTATRYAKLRIAGKNADNALGSWVESGVLTISSGELDMREASESTFGAGLKKDASNRIALTARNLLLNEDFEFGLDEWSQSWVGWTADTTEPESGTYCAKCTAFNALLQHVPASPLQTFRFDVRARSSCNGTVYVALGSYDKDRNWNGGYWIPVTSDTWNTYTVTLQLAANAAFVGVYLELTSGCTTGRALFDKCSLQLVEPLTGPLTRTATGLNINLEPAEFNVVGGKLAQAGVDFSKAIVGKYSGSEFEVSSGAFRVKALAAEKINTGILSVGGGGSKVSKFAVFDTANSAIGWIGDDTAGSGYVGAWMKRMLIGGTSPATAKIAAGSDGSVTITDAPLTLTQNGVITRINNPASGSSGVPGLAIQATASPTRYTNVTERRFVAYTPAGYALALFGNSGNDGAGYARINKADGSQYAQLDPAVLLVGSSTGLYEYALDAYQKGLLWNNAKIIDQDYWVGQPIQVTKGGTGATDAANARLNLGAAASSHTHTGYQPIYGYVTSDPGWYMTDGQIAFWWDTGAMYLVYKQGGSKFRVQMDSY